jgi:hypothetical protein
LSDISDLLDRLNRINSVIYNLNQVMLTLRVDYPDDAKKYELDSNKYYSVRKSITDQISQIQLNCKHQWGFHGYGANDRLFRCSKCLAIKLEASAL